MPRRVPLIALDPDLGEEMEASRVELANRQLVVRLERLPAGRWHPRANEFGALGGLGLIIVDGVALRQITLGHRSGCELLGAGDVLRPWEDDGEYAAYPFSASFRVISPLSLAVLDEPATRALMHFPEIVNRLMGRVMVRSRRVAGYLVVAQLSSVDARLHVALWHIAERFGRVRADGVMVPLRLTHEVLGLIVGARRPSVTAALGRLADRGLVQPRADGWLLIGDPPQSISRPGAAEPEPDAAGV